MFLLGELLAEDLPSKSLEAKQNDQNKMFYGVHSFSDFFEVVI